MFQLGATGCPEQVWAVLTASETTRRFLFGVGLESTWESGSPITGWLDGVPVVRGEVLFAERPIRLSYVLASGRGQPEVYVTWEMRACGSGAIVRLSVDEADNGDHEDVEALWQPAVTALQAVLAGQVHSGEGGDPPVNAQGM